MKSQGQSQNSWLNSNSKSTYHEKAYFFLIQKPPKLKGKNEGKFAKIFRMMGGTSKGLKWG